MPRRLSEASGTSAPSIFISYSHDSSEHVTWVRDLASQLVSNGVSVRLDQWDLRPGADIAKFMERALRESNRVLMVCTEPYVRRAEAGMGGVGYEAMIVTGELFRNLGTTKFIPLVRQVISPIQLPAFLSTRLFIDFSAPTGFDHAFDQLLRELHGAPVFARPPLGSNPYGPQNDLSHSVSMSPKARTSWKSAQESAPRATTGSATTERAVDPADTLLDRWLTRLKDNPGVAFLVIAIIAVGGIAGVREAVYKLLAQPTERAHSGADIGASAVPELASEPPAQEPDASGLGANPGLSQASARTTLLRSRDVVFDTSSSLVWMRNIYGFGCTTALFAKVGAGTESQRTAFARLRTRVEASFVGSINAWRIATADEIHTLQGIPGGSLFKTFHVHRIRTGATNLIGVYLDGSSLKPWGYQHANILRGPFDGDTGSFELNEFGVWMVAGPLEPEQRALTKTWEAIPVVNEPHREAALDPTFAATVVKEFGGSLRMDATDPIARVSNLEGDRRSYFEYDFKAVPKGAFVRADIEMIGRSASGEDPILAFAPYSPSSSLDVDGVALWEAGVVAEDIRWQFGSSARFELPESVARDAYYGASTLGIVTRYAGRRGSVEFQPPRILVSFVGSGDVLTAGDLQHSECGGL